MDGEHPEDHNRKPNQTEMSHDGEKIDVGTKIKGFGKLMLE
jgi:hypothetical protein